MRTDGRIERLTYVTNLIVVFGSFAKATNNERTLL